MPLTICILQSVAFLDLLAIGLIVPLFASHVRKMGGNQIQIGLLGSIYAGVQFLSGPLIGSLSDLKGRKTIFIMTLLVSSVAYASFGIAHSIWVILIIRAVLGCSKQTQMLTRAMVPDYESNQQKQGDIYGKINAIAGAGITLGPVIGGHVAEDFPEYGFSFIAFIVGFCFIMNAGLVALLPKPDIKVKQRKATNSEVSTNIPKMIVSSLKQSILQLYNIEWSIYGDVFFYKGLIGFAMGVYYSNYALYLKTIYTLSPKYIGYIISFQGTVGSLSSFFIGVINSFYTHDKDYSQRNFHVFLLLTIALSGMVMSISVYTYTLCLIPLAVGNAMGRLITLEMILSRSHCDHRGTLIGASNSVRSLTGIISPMVAGVIEQFIGIQYVLYASLLTAILGITLSYQHHSNARSSSFSQSNSHSIADTSHDR